MSSDSNRFGIELQLITTLVIRIQTGLEACRNEKLDSSIHSFCWRGLCCHRTSGLHGRNSNRVWFRMVWLNRQGGPQELRTGIVVGNQFLEEQEKTADILLIADLLQVVQICSHLFCLEVE